VLGHFSVGMGEDFLSPLGPTLPGILEMLARQQARLQLQRDEFERASAVALNVFAQASGSIAEVQGLLSSCQEPSAKLKKVNMLMSDVELATSSGPSLQSQRCKSQPGSFAGQQSLKAQQPPAVETLDPKPPAPLEICAAQAQKLEALHPASSNLGSSVTLLALHGLTEHHWQKPPAVEDADPDGNFGCFGVTVIANIDHESDQRKRPPAHKIEDTEVCCGITLSADREHEEHHWQVLPDTCMMKILPPDWAESPSEGDSEQCQVNSLLVATVDTPIRHSASSSAPGRSPWSSLEVPKTAADLCASLSERHPKDEDAIGKAICRLQVRLGIKYAMDQVTAEKLHDVLADFGLDTYDDEQLGGLFFRMSQRIGNPTLITEAGKKRWWFNSSAQWPSDTPSGSMREQTIEFILLATALLQRDIRRYLELDDVRMLLTIREVLLSGRANKLVAQLTHVQVNDLAAPPPQADCMTFLEPVVALAIILDGLVIGFQPAHETGDLTAWFWTAQLFTFIFVVEAIVRMRLTGMREYFFGADRHWNVFDIFMVMAGITSCLVTVFSHTVTDDFDSLAIVRLLRVARLPRVVRIFRLRRMREFHLMAKGLLGGLNTLFWAVILLFFFIYIFAVFAMTACQSSAQDQEAARLFGSLPEAFLTTFRCFTGDCTTSDGKPIVLLLTRLYGSPFVLSYLASKIFVTFGLFNLIMAIYIEHTLQEAKTENLNNPLQQRREGIRIARLTKRLLKKFCTTYRQRLSSSSGGSMTGRSGRDLDIGNQLRRASLSEMQDINMRVTKEEFLLVIQDPEVQTIMDDLELPPERSNLFDILDADGSGYLEVTELIQGMLRVRGEARKSDAIATLLGVKAAMDLLREQARVIEEIHHRLCESNSISNCQQPNESEVEFQARRMREMSELSCDSLHRATDSLHKAKYSNGI